jgi:rhodanese-related sulfurtransferase
MLPKLLSANALYQRLQQPNDLLLLDVRNSEEFQRGRIETRHTPETLNIPYMEFIEDDTLDYAIERIPRQRPIVVVCAHGGSSEYVAGILRRCGYSVANLASGIEGWSRLHVVRPVVQDESLEIYQFDRAARGCLSYAIISDGWAAIIDPSHYIEEYQALLSACGAALWMIIDTHAHADHISGGPALA